jgi:hypothetical protein
MSAFATTIAISFVCGCLYAVGGHRAWRIFNAATVGGAVLYTAAFLLAFGLSLGFVALVGTALGTYTRETDDVMLASYATGFALLGFICRARSYRQP